MTPVMTTVIAGRSRARRRSRLHGLVVLSIAASLMAIVATARLGAAPDDEDLQQDEPEQEGHMAVNVNWLQQFDMIVFSSNGGVPEARSRLETRFKVQLDELDRTCELSDAQKRKLLLAASGDSKRFFGQVSELRRKFEASLPNQNGNPFNDLWQQVGPLQTKFQAGIYGPDSLYIKTIRSTLNTEQMARYRAMLDSRKRINGEAQLLGAVAAMERSAPLDSQQHEKLVALLREELADLPDLNGDNASWLHGQLSKIPEEKMRAIFDERQWELLKRVGNQFGDVQEMVDMQEMIIEAQPVEADAE
jgi:hypothetical protein